MAFNRQNTAAAAETNNWKAAGFINLYLPSKDGKRVKLGAIPLRESNAKESDLHKWLSANPERVSVLLEKLTAEFRSAEPAAGSGFDLGE